MNVGSMSKAIREILDINQYKLAQMVGTNQTKISLIENGFAPPQKEISDKILKLYNKCQSKMGGGNIKIYLIRNEYFNPDENAIIEVKAYATKELALEAIKPMIKDEIEQQIENGIIERNENGSICFADESVVGDLYVSDCKLSIQDNWGFADDIWIEEVELIGGNI